MNYVLGKNESNSIKRRVYAAGIALLIIATVAIVPKIMANQAPQNSPNNSVSPAIDTNQSINEPEIANTDVSALETIDTEKPVGTAIYTGGAVVSGVRYVKSINELSYTETITDNVGVVRSTFLVQRFNSANSTYELFCGNWNANSTGSLSLGGATSETRTSNVATCRGNNTSVWPDGKYKIAHGAYDAAGNEGKYNTNRQEFVIDTQKPVGIATYTGGALVGDIRYIKSIDDLKYFETINDNNNVARATVLVQKFNDTTDKFESFCGNWNKNSLGSHLLNGTTTETYNGDVKVCRSNDTSPWPDGRYKVFHGAYDAAGNEGKYNTNRQEFVIDTQKPVGIATYTGGALVGNVRYIKSIDDLKYEENISDNDSVARATVLVQKLNTDTQKFESFCGNWNAKSLGSHVLGGTKNETYNGDVKVCRSNDTSPWPDGRYKVFHGAYDNTGNEGKYNTSRQEFVIDTEKPVGIVTYSGGQDVEGVLFIKSIDDLKYEEKITDNDSVARATVLVQKLNPENDTYERFCGNWNAQSTGSHLLGGTKNETYTGDVKVCNSNNAGEWTDGEYKVFHGAYDNTGNEGKYNLVRQLFVIDSTEPEELAIPVTVTTPDVLGINTENTPNRSLPNAPANQTASNTNSTPPAVVARNFASNVVAASGLVLGAATANTSDLAQNNEQPTPNSQYNSNVLGASNTFATTEKTIANGCGKLLGTCWYYWVPVIIAVPAITVYLTSRRMRKVPQTFQ